MYRICYIYGTNEFFCSITPKKGFERLLTKDGRWIPGSFIQKDYYSGSYYDVIRNLREHCGRVRFCDSDNAAAARRKTK